METTDAETASRAIMRSVRSRPTITDVAKLCGVTPATVSRVLNKKKKFSTSEAVREKIFKTAKKLGYVPDLAARNLNRRNTHLIGIFASPATHVSEGINDSLISGVAEVLHAGNYDVFFELSASDRALPFFRFDGAILLQAPRAETVEELDRRHVPYVCVNERVGKPAAYVLADDAMGATHAIEHLVQLGHRRIAYANAKANYFSHYSVTERYATILQVAKKRSLRLVSGHDVPFASAKDFLQHGVIDEGATAVITYDHQMAVMLVGAAQELKLRIPEDFSVICFNDVFPVAILPCPMTAVAVSGREMGRVGADLLLNALTHNTPGEPKEIRVPEDLVVRGSTAAPRTGPIRPASVEVDAAKIDVKSLDADAV